MKKVFSFRLSKLGLLCALLMLALLFMQCATTFWTYGKDKAVSLQGYVWFPTDHANLSKQLNADLGLKGSFNPSTILLFPVLTLFAGAAGIVLNILMPRRFIVALLPIICGGAAIAGYLIKPVLQMGANWQLHLALAVLVLLSGIWALIQALKTKKED